MEKNEPSNVRTYLASAEKIKNCNLAVYYYNSVHTYCAWWA